MTPCQKLEFDLCLLLKVEPCKPNYELLLPHSKGSESASASVFLRSKLRFMLHFRYKIDLPFHNCECLCSPSLKYCTIARVPSISPCFWNFRPRADTMLSYLGNIFTDNLIVCVTLILSRKSNISYCDNRQKVISPSACN
ncbi:hypothetical protein LguiA_019740 [Lonicera macranthoides]